MGQQVIEGTWEEVAAHAPELRGHRVRVTILDGSEDSVVNEEPSQAPTLVDCLNRMKDVHGHSAGRKWTREDLYSNESLH